MVQTANINPASPSDGLTYSNAVPLTATEADLAGGGNAPFTPIGTEWGQTIVAVVKLSINGIVTQNSTYIVMQTDMGDGTWIDLAWLVWGGGQGSATFVLCAGGIGAMNNAIQQTRASGSPPAPQTLGSNALPLGGRVRFVGKSNFLGGSSSLAGVTTAVLATITYRLQAPR